MQARFWDTELVDQLSRPPFVRQKTIPLAHAWARCRYPNLSLELSNQRSTKVGMGTGRTIARLVQCFSDSNSTPARFCQLLDPVADLLISAQIRERSYGSDHDAFGGPPPIHSMRTFTRSLVPSTSPLTRSTTWRMISLRSTKVVVGAAHRAGISVARRRIACRSVSVSKRGFCWTKR